MSERLTDHLMPKRQTQLRGKRALEVIGTPPQLMALVSCIYHGSWNSCATPEGKVKYRLRRGIKEGCPLSPALFMLLYETFHETLRREFPEAAFYG